MKWFNRRTKGVFITTSDFADTAVAYAKKVPQKVILIDGDRLASLMIEHNIGGDGNEIEDKEKEVIPGDIVCIAHNGETGEGHQQCFCREYRADERAEGFPNLTAIDCGAQMQQYWPHR